MESPRRRRDGKWRGARTLLAVVILGLAAPAHADDISGRAILSYQQFDTDVFRTDGFHQTYDLRLQRFLLPTLQVRGSFRGEKNDGTADFGEGNVKNAFWQIQPGAEVLYILPKFQLQGTYDLLRSNSSNGIVAGSERRLEREVGRLSWMPDLLPSLSLQAERRVNEDRGSGLSQTETLVYGGLDYAWKKLKATATERYTRLDDGGVGFARKSLETQGQLSYDDTFWGGKLTTTASVLGSTTRLDERALATTGVLVPTQVPVAQAWSGIDDTPLDDRDHPLAANTLLKDGNLDVPADVSIGPDGQLYGNVAVDLTRVVGIDELRLHVRDEAGNRVPLGGPVRWDVFVSADNVTWSPLPGGARTFFNVPLSRYEVTFITTESRFFKVVSFGLNSVDTRVTEIEAYYHTEVGPQESRRTRIALGNATASVSARPIQPLLLSYYGLFNTVSQSGGGRASFSSRDSDQTISAEVFPFRTLSFLARYQKRGITQTGDFRQTYDAVSGVLRYAMNRNLSLSLEGLRSDEDNAGILSTTRGVTFHTYARLLPAIDLSVDVGSQKQEFSADQRSADRLFLSGVSIAQLTDDLKLTLQASVQRSTYAQSVDLGPASDSRDERYTAEAFWRPSQQVALWARFGWAAGDLVSGLTQRYRVEWYPFPGGTVSLGGTYDQDVDPYAQRRSKRVMISPRWTINRHAVFDLNYSLVEVTGVSATTTKIFYANLTLTF